MKHLSFITVVYDDLEGLSNTLESLKKNIFMHKQWFEVLVIDGSEKEEINDLCSKFLDLNINLISESDRGIYDAMNKGIDASEGSYLWFINSGDKLSIRVDDEFNKYLSSNLDLIFLGYRRRYKNKTLSENLPKRRSLELGMPTVHQSIIYNNALLKDKNKYRLDLKICSDYEHFSRISALPKKTLFIDQIAIDFDCNGISSRKPLLLIFESFSITMKSKLKLYQKTYVLIRTLAAVIIFQIKRFTYEIF